MSKLILIKHAAPQKDETIPAHEWRLSDQGRAAARRLADHIQPHQPIRIITSREPKAIETGTILAEALGIASEQADGLHEHDRSNVPMMRTREFISAVAQFFKEPDALTLGKETATAAKQRITAAIQAVTDRYPEKNIAIVTHGTVLALYATDYLPEPPFQLWRNLGLPSMMVFDQPGMQLVDRLDSVT